MLQTQCLCSYVSQFVRLKGGSSKLQVPALTLFLLQEGGVCGGAQWQ